MQILAAVGGENKSERERQPGLYLLPFSEENQSVEKPAHQIIFEGNDTPLYVEINSRSNLLGVLSKSGLTTFSGINTVEEKRELEKLTGTTYNISLNAEKNTLPDGGQIAIYRNAFCLAVFNNKASLSDLFVPEDGGYKKYDPITPFQNTGVIKEYKGGLLIVNHTSVINLKGDSLEERLDNKIPVGYGVQDEVIKKRWRILAMDMLGTHIALSDSKSRFYIYKENSQPSIEKIFESSDGSVLERKGLKMSLPFPASSLHFCRHGTINYLFMGLYLGRLVGFVFNPADPTKPLERVYNKRLPGTEDLIGKLDHNREYTITGIKNYYFSGGGQRFLFVSFGRKIHIFKFTGEQENPLEDKGHYEFPHRVYHFTLKD